MNKTKFNNIIENICKENNGSVLYDGRWDGSRGQWKPILKNALRTSSITFNEEITPIKGLSHDKDIYCFETSVTVFGRRKDLFLVRDESETTEDYAAVISI